MGEEPTAELLRRGVSQPVTTKNGQRRCSRDAWLGPQTTAPLPRASHMNEGDLNGSQSKRNVTRSNGILWAGRGQHEDTLYASLYTFSLGLR